MGNTCSHGDEEEPHGAEPLSEMGKATAPLPAPDKMIHIVVRSMGGEAVLCSSVSASVAVASICQQVAEAIETRPSCVQLLCGSARCERRSIIENYIETGMGDYTLELTYIVGRAPVFEIHSFSGTGRRDCKLQYEWNADHDPADAFTIMCWVKAESSDDPWTKMYNPENKAFGVTTIRTTEVLRGWWMGTGLHSITRIHIDTWYHVALVFTGTDLRSLQMYVNGKLDGSCIISRNIFDMYSDRDYKPAQRNLWIGGDVKEEMRDVRIYAEALSAGEVRNEFLHGVPDPI